MGKGSDPVRYEALRHKLKTGDIVLYSGKGPLSATIRFVTRSRWSHIGLVLQLPKEFDCLTVWESTTGSRIEDLMSGEILRGVQLVPLSERVRLYDGDIAVRRLLDFKLTSKRLKKLMKLRKELRGKPYEQDFLELIRAALDGPLTTPNEEDLRSIFCSELVAEAYQTLGLLDETMASNEYTPADFGASRRLKLKKGGRLGKEILLRP